MGRHRGGFRVWVSILNLLRVFTYLVIDFMCRVEAPGSFINA